MIYTDVLRAFILVLIPILTVFHFLSVWMIYPIGFFGVTLSIFFDTAQFAVIPSLVGEDQLVTANGRIIASYSVAFVIGPLLAGLLIIVIPLPYLLLFDAVSYVISAYSLTLVRSNFSVSERDKTRTIRQDVYTGLHYVLKNPVLLTVSIMMAIVNFVSNTVPSQIVFFAKEQLHADDAKVGVLYAVGSVGVIIFSLLATRIRKLYPFSKIVLISLLLRGIVTIALAFTSLYWAALPLWAVIIGLNNLFNINTNSLRQAIVPKHLLGRVASIASVIAWSSIPLGNLIGGVLVEETKSIQIVYAAIGAIVIVIACVFFYTPLGHTEKFGV